jgi:two-component system sensor histidine kinase BaeS
VTVGILLAASIAASSLLSRRATLVEVRQMVKQTAAVAPALTTIKVRLEEELARGGDMNSALATVAKDSDRSLVLVDAQQQIVAGSRPELATAHVRTATPDGELVLDLAESGVTTALAIRGAPPVAIAGADGRPIGMLYALPARDAREPLDPPLLTPLVLMNAAVMAVALVLSFGLSRQILRPVGELKAAAARMESGDLDVQVQVRGRDEIADLGRTFNSMASRLAETERLRRQLVSDVAHELRSPVTNLRCTLEAIQDGLAPADRASIDALHEETLFLQRLISDLQELALAEAGRLTLNLGDVDLEDVMRRAASAMAKAPGAVITVAVNADLPRIVGDADRLEQVLRNLLSNARRHTPADGSISVGASPEDAVVRITVQDTGAGIPSEHLPHVFDRFYRADQSRARATGGAGLGLAIARQIVAAHGGVIEATSAGAGLGTTFTIDIPIVQR